MGSSLQARIVLVAIGPLLVLSSCSRSPSDAVSTIDPRGGASRALAEFDANKDGALDTKELEKCPALKAAVGRIDTNSDGRLSSEELADRLKFLQNQGLSDAVSVEVTYEGRPLSGATVALVPEQFMGPGYKRASGETDQMGTAVLQIEGSGVSLPSGYYRVEVSKKDAKGQELIPARYNAQSILGYEVAPDSRGRGSEGGTLVLRLTRSGK